MCQIFKHCRCNTSDSVLSKMHREHLCRRSPVKSPAMFFYKTSGKLKPLTCTLLLSLSIYLIVQRCRGPITLPHVCFASQWRQGMCRSVFQYGCCQNEVSMACCYSPLQDLKKKKKQSQVNLWTTEVCSNHRGEFFLKYVKVLGHFRPLSPL